jgi:hypothetical protein
MTPNTKMCVKMWQFFFPDKNYVLKKFGKNVGKWQQNIHFYLRLKLGV